MNTVLATLGLASLAGLAACAAPVAADAVAPAGLRLLVKLAHPSADAAAIAREASAAAGVPVRYLAATSMEWHALALTCDSRPLCDAAVQRLRADTAAFAAVERDERRRPVSP